MCIIYVYTYNYRCVLAVLNYFVCVCMYTCYVHTKRRISSGLTVIGTLPACHTCDWCKHGCTMAYTVETQGTINSPSLWADSTCVPSVTDSWETM